MEAMLALALGGLLVLVVLNLLAARLRIPAAVLMVVAGSAYAWLPGPNVSLRPHVVLEVVIPPLLYAAALNSSAVGLRANLRTVTSLSLGLVVATAFVVGGLVSSLISGLPLGAAVALGAAVSPSDPVAALAIGRRAGLPARLITIIEGEGLLNDAAALTLLQVAVAEQVSGSVSVLHSIGLFGLAVVGGTAVGIVVAAVLADVRRRLDEPLADNAISLATPFAAFLPAEAIHGSGVLAVVVAGLWFAHRGPTVQSSQSRLQSRAVWSFVEYLLEGFVFLLVGQQLPTVLSGLSRYPTHTTVLAAVASVGGVLVTRVAWLLLSEGLVARASARVRDGGAPGRALRGRDLVALSWSGTRGVITLAAAFSLPLTLHSTQAFPDRDLLLFCAYLVVVVTLIGQGLTFAPVARALGFAPSGAADSVRRNEARIAAVHAGLTQLDVLAENRDVTPVVTDAIRHTAQHRLDRYTSRIDRLSVVDADDDLADDPYVEAALLRRELIAAEREELLRWRDDGRLSDVNLRILQRELDHEESLLPSDGHPT